MEYRINTEELLDLLICIDPACKSEIKEIEEKFNCTINFDIEKHHTLQLTYYYEIDFGKEENFFVEIESGISNGTQIIDETWGYSTKTNTRETEVLKDVVFSDKAFDASYNGPKSKKAWAKRKAKVGFEMEKPRLLELHRNRSYDNYVTGGGTGKTHSHYKNEYSEMKRKGIYFKYVYEVQEVDRNFI